LEDPPDLPVRQQEFDIFGSVIHSFPVGSESADYVNDHVQEHDYVDAVVVVLVDVAVDAFWGRVRVALRPL
jgi:hypothetical protein